MDQTRAEHVRKTLTAVSMLLAPLCLVVADLLWPVTHTDAGDILADAGGSTGSVYTSMVICFIGLVFFMGAILGLAHMLHERRPRMEMTGAALASIGLLAIAAVVGAMGMLLFEAAQPGRNAAAMADLIDDFMGSAVFLFACTWFLSIGMIVMAWGLFRTHVVASWSAICIAVAAVGAAVGNPLALKPVVVLADLVLLAGLGSIGWTVLAETDEEWEHTPQFHGFTRPAMG